MCRCVHLIALRLVATLTSRHVAPLSVCGRSHLPLTVCWSSSGSGTDQLTEELALERRVPRPRVGLHTLLSNATFLYSLLKIYRSEFSRGDSLFDFADEQAGAETDRTEPTPEAKTRSQINRALHRNRNPKPPSRSEVACSPQLPHYSEPRSL